MHSIFLVIVASLMTFVGLVIGKILGYDIKWWQIVFVPPIISIVGLFLLALPFIILGVCLYIIQ